MTEAQNLIEAIKTINSKRVELAGVDALWNKLYNAANYLNKQLAKRDARHEDYGDHGLIEGVKFVRWETRETIAPDAWLDNELFQESFGFRPNGPNVKDIHKHGIYSKDLNGDYLDKLTPDLLKELEITLEIEAEE